jgi:hypothetical protein
VFMCLQYSNLDRTAIALSSTLFCLLQWFCTGITETLNEHCCLALGFRLMVQPGVASRN